MRKIRINLMACLAVLACVSLGFLHSCKEDDDKLFAGVNGSEVTILLGESYQYNLELVTSGDASADGITATWSSADATIASVDQTGLVTANEVGTTIITASLSNGQHVTSMVTVEKPESMIFQLWTPSSGDTLITNIEEVYYQPDGLPTKVYLSLAANTLTEDSVTLSVEDPDYALFADPTDPTIQFPDTTIAVNTDTIFFNIKPGLLEGDTRINVTNGTLRSYLTVHVGPVVNLSWDRVNEMLTQSMSVYLQDGEQKLTAYATVYGGADYWQREGLYEYEVTQSGSATAALIEDFDQLVEGEISWTIKPQALGTTKMTVRSRGEVLNFVLKVVDKQRVKVNALTINYNERCVAYADADSTFTSTVPASTATRAIYFEALTTPLNAAATWPVTWSSSNPDVAACAESGDGNFNILADGTTEITAYAGDPETPENYRTATFTLVVKTDVTGLAVSTSSRSTIMQGEAVPYEFTTTPAGFSPEVVWETDNAEIATFEGNVLHAHAAGQVNITVRTADGMVESEPYTVTINEPFDFTNYDYTGGNYMYSITNNGRLSLMAERVGESGNASTLTAVIDNGDLTSGTYTIGENMNNVQFMFESKPVQVTNGTITVTDGDNAKEFTIDLTIGLEGNPITLTGTLDDANCLN